MSATAEPARAANPRRLLRRAALAPAAEALGAWNAWRADAARPHLDPASDWWLPLVWWNLRHVVTGAAAAGLRHRYRDAWVRNQHLLARVAPVLDALDRAGIETLLLKGAALALATYERPGLRPFGDVDVLVHPPLAARAHDVLASLGWAPFRALAPDLRAALHGMGYVHATGATLDLHAYALAECTVPAIDDGFWSRSRAFDVNGVRTRVLASTDAFLHACVHGLRYHDIPTSHWMADAVMIRRRAGDALDWRTLVDEARARRLTFQLDRAIAALDAEGVDVPREIRAALATPAAAWWERLECRAKQRATRRAAAVQAWCTEQRTRALAPHAALGAATRLQAAAGAPTRATFAARAARALVGLARDGASRTFDACGCRVKVQVDDGVDAAAVFAKLADRMPPFARVRGGEIPDRVYRLMAGDPAASVGGSLVLVIAAPLARAATVDLATDHLVADLQTYLAQVAPGRIFVHAGVVVIGGRAVMLPGRSGAGKSTLVAALVDAGAEYLSDEFAVIDAAGGIHAYARPIRLRTPGGERRVHPRARRGPAVGPAPRAGRILFTTFDPASRFAPAPLTPGAALLQLIAHCPSAHARPADMLAACRAVASDAAAWSSPRPNTDVVVRRLMEEMSGPSLSHVLG
jgi:hypothetical protein